MFSWELEIQNKVKKAAQTSSNDPDGFLFLCIDMSVFRSQEPGAMSDALTEYFTWNLAWSFRQLTHLGFMESSFLGYFICLPG